MWINATSGEEVTAATDSRVKIRTISNGGTFSQILIYNATKYDTGKWTCSVNNTLFGERNAYFNISLYGKLLK